MSYHRKWETKLKLYECDVAMLGIEIKNIINIRMSKGEVDNVIKLEVNYCVIIYSRLDHVFLNPKTMGRNLCINGICYWKL